jgi:colanic acid biosynthesis glycosyl transferase WcaI
MRILLIHRWFWPDAPPYASMLRSIGRRLVEEGHEVTVLTAQPSYNRATRGEKRPRVEQLDGMTVRRARLLPESKRNYLLRGLNMLLFMGAVRRTILAAKGTQAYDAVMASTMPPVLVAASARRAARRRGAAFLYHMMDIYPEIALVSGMKKEGALTRWLGRVDARNCEQAARVIVLSEDMKEAIAVRGLDVSNVAVRNNFRLESFDGDETDAALPPGLAKPEGAFRLLFAGNLGRFQGLEQVLEAVKRVAPEHPELRLDFLGEGHARTRLEEQAGELLGRQVFFHGYLPLEQAAAAVRTADLSLVTLQPHIIRHAYPSKTMTCLAEGSPLLAMVEPDSELARMVRDEQVGFVAPQEDPAALAEALRQALATAPAERAAMGERARTLAERAFTTESSLPWWCSLFRDLRG